jgi:flagellar basal body-associated protein FliL
MAEREEAPHQAAGTADGGLGSSPTRLRSIRTRIGRNRVPFALIVGALVMVMTAGIFVSSDPATVSQSVVELDLEGPLVYLSFPEFIADLKSPRHKVHHIRLAIVVQLPQQQTEKLEQAKTTLIASMQERLRDYTREELSGQHGAARLRSDLLQIVNQSLAPGSARTVLFTQFLID